MGNWRTTRYRQENRRLAHRGGHEKARCCQSDTRRSNRRWGQANRYIVNITIRCPRTYVPGAKMTDIKASAWAICERVAEAQALLHDHTEGCRFTANELVAIGPVRHDRLDVLSNFIAAYKSLRKSLAVGAKSLIQKYAALMGTAIVGAASMYNPYRDGTDPDEMQTASGELYNPAAWTAAIQIDLREKFRGVRYGQNYQPAYALVESGERKAIVKINDVGPLNPGRVIDLNERSMRYFDPTQQLGLISEVKVTLLPGADWTPGPIRSEQLISVASAK